MLRSIFHDSERGDTIVEVLLCLAILGLALSISYATANRALLIARNAEEHSEALQYLNSQVELARADASDASLYNEGSTFCMDNTTGKPVVPGCSVGTDNRYQISNSYIIQPVLAPGPQDIFTFSITWPGVSDLGQQHEHITYKIHQL